MTIEFIYNNGETSITTSARGERSLGAVIGTFKDFLLHVGYDVASVERILYVEGEHQGFRQRGDGNPYQGDFFDDTEDYQSDGTDEESGV